MAIELDQINVSVNYDEETIQRADKIMASPKGNTLWELFNISGISKFTKKDAEEQVFDVIELLIDKEFKFEEFKDHRDNKKGWTALHLAVDRGFVTVCHLLISKTKLCVFELAEKQPNGRQWRPITLATYKDSDAVAELLLKKAKNSKSRQVRELMSEVKVTNGSQTEIKPPEIKLHDILKKKGDRKMPKTTIALLDCLMENWRMRGKYKLTYDVLEADSDGHPPQIDGNTGKWNWKESPLQIMVSEKQKNFLNHLVVRQLLERKWSLYAWSPYMASFILYLLTLLCLTFTIWADVFTQDVLVYDDALDYARAVTEFLSYLTALLSLIVEMIQVCKFRLKYVSHDKYNLVELPSALVLAWVLPIRYIDVGVHWYFLSIGYLLWVLRIFKYTALNRNMATYTGLFWQLMRDVFLPFSALFLVLDLAFGGAILVALKADGDLDINNETSSFQMILLTGFRTLAESGPVVEDYVGVEGYRFWSCFLMLLFMFLIIVVLFNILIAQLTDSLPKASRTVDRNVNFKKAQIIDSIDRCTFQDVNLFRKIPRCEEDRKYVAWDVLDLNLQEQMDGDANSQYML